MTAPLQDIRVDMDVGGHQTSWWVIAPGPMAAEVEAWFLYREDYQGRRFGRDGLYAPSDVNMTFTLLDAPTHTYEPALLTEDLRTPYRGGRRWTTT